MDKKSIEFRELNMLFWENIEQLKETKRMPDRKKDSKAEKPKCRLGDAKFIAKIINTTVDNGQKRKC